MNVTVKPSFHKELAKFQDADKILDALRKLEELPSLSESKHLKKITGAKNMFRLKIGKYRALLRWDKDTQTLIAEVVGLRKDIYKKK
jgi:mRNA-degrading endonuclease RelE of RelBE toxin-antitoxin system